MKKVVWEYRFKRQLKKVINNIEPIPKYIYNVKVSSLFPLSEYNSNNIFIKPISSIESLLQLTISGYDKIDVQYQLFSNLDDILAVIAVETNCPFWISKSPNIELMDFGSNKSFTQNLDWMNGYPLKERFLTISENGVEIINQITCTYLERSLELEKFIHSCPQFHFARKQDAIAWDGGKIQTIIKSVI